MRALDWSKTPLGPISAWPQSLLTSISTCLDCALPILIWWGPEFVMLYNDAYRAILGSEKHPAALGAPGRAVWPELWDVIGPMLGQVVSAGEAKRSEDLPRVMNRHGYPEETYFSFFCSPIRDETGGVGGVFSPVIETTAKVTPRADDDADMLQTEARRAADQALRDESLRTLRLFEQAPSLICVLRGPDHRYAFANAAYRRFVGERALIGRKIDEARLRDLNETLERRVSEALAERKVLADIFEGTDAFIQVADRDFRWMAINRASAEEFERIYGKRPRAGDNMLELLADRPEHAAAVKAVWSRALAGEAFTQIDEFGDPGLGRRWYEMKFNVLRDQNGRQIGAYQFVYDVTARICDQMRLAEAEAALRQAQKLDAMGQLTGGVAHDFNNLLTPILGALDLLHRRQVGGEREQRLISGALQSGERAKTLVQRLLAFARRQPLQACAIDVRAVIDGMADLIASTTGPQIAVTIDLARDLPLARADAHQLEMAVLNLSVNARDAMERGGGALRISADVQEVATGSKAKLAPGRYVRVSVADTGAGMSQEVLDKAVEPFFSTKGIGKGTGLGLSMVHGLATQLGGGLVIESQPGQGTTVALWLPVSAEPLAGAPALATGAPALPPVAGRALVVDDEDLVRASAADMLTELGFEILEASSAEEALEMLASGRPVDLLITDHLMPGMSGAALVYEVRKRWPQIRTVVISGYADAEGIGPDLLRLNKPFRQSEMARVLVEAASGWPA